MIIKILKLIYSEFYNFIGKIFFVFFKYKLKIIKNIDIMNGTLLSKDSNIGKYTYIGYNCGITKTNIGNYCSIANNVSIGMGEHKLNNISTNSLFYKDGYRELTKLKCNIGNDVWIGVDSIIRRGVKIGNGAVVGANSFVNKDVPPYSIVVGNPAKIIKYRFNKKKIITIENSKWWNFEKKEAEKIINNINNNDKTYKKNI